MCVLDQLEGSFEVTCLLDEVFEDGKHLFEDGEVFQAFEKFDGLLFGLLEAISFDHILQTLLLQKLRLLFLLVHVTAYLPHLSLYSVEGLESL